MQDLVAFFVATREVEMVEVSKQHAIYGDTSNVVMVTHPMLSW